jgi:hypothetical protein
MSDLVDRFSGGAVHEPIAIVGAEAGHGEYAHTASGICLAEDEIQVGRVEVDVCHANQAFPPWPLMPRENIEQHGRVILAAGRAVRILRQRDRIHH